MKYSSWKGNGGEKSSTTDCELAFKSASILLATQPPTIQSITKSIINKEKMTNLKFGFMTALKVIKMVLNKASFNVCLLYRSVYLNLKLDVVKQKQVAV